MTQCPPSSLHSGCSMFGLCLCPKPGIGEPNPQSQTSLAGFAKIDSYFQEGLAG
jgi:hypothetical protein